MTQFDTLTPATRAVIIAGLISRGHFTIKEAQDFVDDYDKRVKLQEYQKQLSHIRWMLNNLKPHTKNGLALAEKLVTDRIEELKKQLPEGASI